MEDIFRCKCPITSALDIIGDKWSLVVIKQMLFERKSTFKDFAESKESIATNILSSRLKLLEHFGIIQKEKLPNNKKTNIYILTKKGLALTPTLIELTLWSNSNINEFHPDLNINQLLESSKKNKEQIFSNVISDYKKYANTILNQTT